MAVELTSVTDSCHTLVTPQHHQEDNMADLPEGITQEDLDRYVRITTGITKLTEEKDELNQKIKDAFYTDPTFISKGKLARTYGTVLVDITSTTTFDKKLFAAQFPPTEFPMFYKPEPDQTKLSPTEKKPFQSTSPRLSVKSLD
jgi:hypothetical protein